MASNAQHKGEPLVSCWFIVCSTQGALVLCLFSLDIAVHLEKKNANIYSQCNCCLMLISLRISLYSQCNCEGS